MSITYYFINRKHSQILVILAHHSMLIICVYTAGLTSAVQWTLHSFSILLYGRDTLHYIYKDLSSQQGNGNCNNNNINCYYFCLFLPPLSLCPPLSLPLSLLFFFPSLPFPLSPFSSLPLSLFFSPSLSPPLSIPLSLLSPSPLSLPLSLSPSVSPSVSPSLSLSPSLPFPLSLPLSLLSPSLPKPSLSLFLIVCLKEVV